MADVKPVKIGTSGLAEFDSGDTVPVANGGTGATSASGARTNLGLAIGTDVQAYDATLAALAGYSTVGVVVSTGTDTFAGRTIMGTSDEITVNDGSGTSGNPTISLATSLILTGKTITVTDSLFSIADNGDSTKKLEFQCSGLTSGTTRTLTVQDVSGTIYVGGGTDVAIADGGTGASNAYDARVNLGIAKAFRVHIHGLTLSNNASDATNDIDIAAGNAWDNTNDVLLDLTSGLTKRLEATWAVGTNQGGLDTGSKANSTWYHVWLIRRSDTGVVDVLFSTSVSSPTMPTNYDQKRRIGSIYVQSSGVIAPFEQVEDRFALKPAISIVNTTAPPTTPTNLTILSPPGIQCRAIVTIAVSSGSGNKLYRVGTVTATYDIDTYVIGTGSVNYVVVDVMTNTSSQIVHYANTASSITCYLNSNGWYDTRGRGA